MNSALLQQTLDSYGQAKSGSGGCQLPTEVMGWATFALTDEVHLTTILQCIRGSKQWLQEVQLP